MIEIAFILTSALWISYFFKTIISLSDMISKKGE